MEFSTKAESPDRVKTGCIVAGVFESRRLSDAARLLDRAAGGRIGSILRQDDWEGKLGSTLLLHAVSGVSAERVLLVGLGKEEDFGLKEYREAARAAVRALNETGAADAALYFGELPVKNCDPGWRAMHLA